MIHRQWCLLGDAGIISDALDKTRYRWISYELCILHFYCRVDGWRFVRANFGLRLLGPFQGPPKKKLKENLTLQSFIFVDTRCKSSWI